MAARGARAGQSLPVVGFLGGRASEPWLASFRNGLGEIDTAFAALARERADALLVAGDVFFGSRRKEKPRGIIAHPGAPVGLWKALPGEPWEPVENSDPEED